MKIFIMKNEGIIMKITVDYIKMKNEKWLWRLLLFKSEKWKYNYKNRCWLKKKGCITIMKIIICVY